MRPNVLNSLHLVVIAVWAQFTILPVVNCLGADSTLHVLFVSDYMGDLDENPTDEIENFGAEEALLADYFWMKRVFNNSGLFPNERIRFVAGREGLVGRQATGENLINAVNSYDLTGFSQDDVFVFMITCHGMTNNQSGKHEFQLRHSDGSIGNVKRETIIQSIQSRGFQNIVFLSSSCAAFSQPNDGMLTSAGGEQFPDVKTMQDLFFHTQGVTDVGAAIPGKYAYISSAGTGTNFYANFWDALKLPHALLDKNQNGVVTWPEFMTEFQALSSEDHAVLVSRYSNMQATHQLNPMSLGTNRYSDSILYSRTFGFSYRPYQNENVAGIEVTAINRAGPAYFAFANLPLPFLITNATYDLPPEATCVCQGQRTMQLTSSGSINSLISQLKSDTVNSSWVKFDIELRGESQPMIGQPVQAYLPEKQFDPSDTWIQSNVDD